MEDKFEGLVVLPGKFRLNDARLVVDHDNVKIWEVDCASKYPYLPLMIGDALPVYPCNESLHLDETVSVDTMIKVPGEWDGIMWDGGRYTIRIVAFRWPPREEREGLDWTP